MVSFTNKNEKAFNVKGCAINDKDYRQTSVISVLLPGKCLMTAWRLPYVKPDEWQTIALCQPDDILMTFWWLSDETLMIFWWLPDYYPLLLTKNDYKTDRK